MMVFRSSVAVGLLSLLLDKVDAQAPTVWNNTQIITGIKPASKPSVLYALVSYILPVRCPCFSELVSYRALPNFPFLPEPR